MGAEIVDYIKERGWVGAATLVALLLVLAIKAGKIPKVSPDAIPPQWRPAAAFALGAVTLALKAAIAGTPILPAVLDGTLGGAGAVGLHQLVTQPIEAGSVKPPSPPSVLPPVISGLFWGISALAVLGALTGCAQAKELEHVVQASSVVIEKSEPCLVSQYEAAQRVCLQEMDLNKAEACIKSVRNAYAPIATALGDLRDARCKLEPAKCEVSK